MSHQILRKDPVSRFRASVSRGAPEKVSRKGGEFGAGVIRQASIIMRGEALGHGAFVDATMLEQVRDGVKSAGKNGIKARFTHPGMSSDGMGKFLGKFKNAKLEGDKVLADIHFAESSHKTPEGDLATYVMDLAEETPEDFGVSIVFERDVKAEREFRALHTQDEIDDEGFTSRRFKSPDPKNSKNFEHVRLKKLRAADVVDTPAANEDGLFSETNIASDATSLISFALGLTDEAPESELFSEVSPGRIKGFVARWMESEGYEIRQVESGGKVKNEPMKGNPDQPDSPPPAQPSAASEPTAPTTQETPKAPAPASHEVNASEFSEFQAWKKKQEEDKFNAAVDARVKETLSSYGVKRPGEAPASATGGGSADDTPPPATPYAELYQAEVTDKRTGDAGGDLKLAQAFKAKYGTEQSYNQKHNL